MWPFTHHTERGKRGEPMPAKHDGLPDSTHPSGLCPRCGKQSSFDVAGSLPLSFDGTMVVQRDETRVPVHHEQASVLICRHCHQGVSVLEQQLTETAPGATGPRPPRLLTWRGFHWWPLPDYKSHEAIPSEIADAFNEAQTALAANCPRAAAVMARRTLEAIADDKGQTTGSLAERLKKMTEAGLLQPVLADWAKEVRLIGNIGAHYDPMKAVSIEDAKQLTKFIQELLSYVYILPAELEKARSSRG